MFVKSVFSKRVVPSMRYSADITAGALKVPESRVIAGLLLREVTDEQWRKAIYDENVLQARSPKTAKRLSVLIRGRLARLKSPLWKLVRDGSAVEATHACLAAAVKASYLLGDFLDLVVREQYRTFKDSLALTLWADYIDDCRGRDPDMPQWSESTITRLRSSIFTILARPATLTARRPASSKRSTSSSRFCDTSNNTTSSMSCGASRWEHDRSL